MIAETAVGGHVVLFGEVVAVHIANPPVRRLYILGPGYRMGPLMLRSVRHHHPAPPVLPAHNVLADARRARMGCSWDTLVEKTMATFCMSRWPSRGSIRD
jgi:hypothetical protein